MPSAFKVVRADRRSPFVTPGIVYEPAATIVHRAGKGVSAYTTRERAETVAGSSGRLRVIELSYSQDDAILDSRDVVRLMRCRVVPEPGDKVPRKPPVIDVPTPRERLHEHAATARAAAILDGRRHLTHEQDDEIGRLVRKKVTSAKRKARRAAA
jgi:hypothetical protein